MKKTEVPPSKVEVRKHLSADALIGSARSSFEQIPEWRSGNADICLEDALMSGFAMFSLKDPSLLAFEKRRTARDHNLRTIYGIKRVPCDSRMREIIDRIAPEWLRPAFLEIFRNLQRGKALEPMAFMDGCYLLSLDGTGYFSSEKLHSPSCMMRVSKTGKITYYLQMLGAAIVHPDFKEVIPVCPEMIQKQDGQSKNDCERNAAKRFLANFRADHPNLKVIVVEDALSPNAPHIRDLLTHRCHFILGVKPGDHEFLFKGVDRAVKAGEAVEVTMDDPEKEKVGHFFRFVNGVVLNQSNPDLLVNVLEYWEVSDKGTKSFSWVTDFPITKENAYQIMRGGRARWKIENETFNTLKNQGYQFEHNFGLGKEHLSTNFVQLMMLAFLVDQAQQLCCALFRSVWKKLGSKKEIWEQMRAMFYAFNLESMEMLYRALLYGHEKQAPIILGDSS